MQKKPRKKLVWEIDRQLQEDTARPIIYQYRLGTCVTRECMGSR